jgi:hypothetical protein
MAFEIAGDASQRDLELARIDTVGRHHGGNQWVRESVGQRRLAMAHCHDAALAAAVLRLGSRPRDASFDARRLSRLKAPPPATAR